MPYKSDKQRRAMHAAAEGRGTIGIDPEAARRFTKHTHEVLRLTEDKGMADSNPLLDFVRKHTAIGKKVDKKKEYDRLNTARQEAGKPALPPYEEWLKMQGAQGN